ncbi:hypothetical protein GmHk_15G044105 [Glycine max]|nr:hypothetical protein GmHk_15G044105 [Glycine max]
MEERMKLVLPLLQSSKELPCAGKFLRDEKIEIMENRRVREDGRFAANGISAAGLRAFDGVLQSNITLKTLDLSGNLVGDEGAKGAKAIAEMLKENSSLRVLTEHLKFCSIPKKN